MGRTIKGKKAGKQVHIPDDLALCILSKLPLKSCKRFRCVRKSWSLLFKNPHFMTLFRNHFLFNNTSDPSHTFLLLREAELPLTPERQHHCAFYLLPNDRFEDRIKFNLPPPFQEDDSNLYILNSVSINGILCLVQSRRLVLWNPATHEFRVIPPSHAESVPPYHEPTCAFEGFGYDTGTDDYKLIRFYFDCYRNEHVPREDRSQDPMLEIYSVRSNSWRIIHADLDDCYFNYQNGVYLNGTCHWWTYYVYTSTRSIDDCNGYLVSFDFSDEVFFKTPLTLDLGDRSVAVPMVLNESVALISYSHDTTVFHISILGDLGQEQSWFKLCIIRTIPPIDRPVGVWRKDNIYFRTKNYEPVWINLSTGLIHEIDIKREHYSHQIGVYTQNLLSRIGGTHY